jgi:hypothetical protein
VVIGHIQDKVQKALFDQILEQNQGLEAIALNLIQQEDGNGVPNFEALKVTRRQISIGEIDEHQQGIQIGLVDVAKGFVGDLRGEGSVKEGWERLRVASDLCGIDLADRLNQKKPLTRTELERLQSKVQDLMTYGSHAALLWKLVRVHQADSKHLHAIQLVSDKQFKFLSASFDGKRKAISECRSFNELDWELKNVFLKAAKDLPKAYLKKNQDHFESWLQQEINDQELILPDLSRELRYSPSDQGYELGPIDGERKERPMGSSVQKLFEQLGGIDLNRRQDDVEQRLSLGILRAQVLALMSDLDPSIVKQGPLTQKFLLALHSSKRNLERQSGAICYLFSTLKETYDPDTLKIKYACSKDLIETIKNRLIKYPELIIAIHKAGELGGLEPRWIYVLSKIAKTMPSVDLLDMNIKYPLEQWIVKSSRKNSPISLIKISNGSDSDDGRRISD